MKTTLIIFFVILSSSLALGETYTWEDADAIHYTDNPDSIPEKYRKNVFEESKKEIQISKPQTIESPTLKQNNTSAKHTYDTSNAAKSPQFPLNTLKSTYAPINKIGDFEPISKFLIAVILISTSLLIVWILEIADIIRSEFTYSSNKFKWLLFIIVMPPLGMLLYLIIGLEQKKRKFSFQTRADSSDILV